jgi:MFS family permease
VGAAIVPFGLVMRRSLPETFRAAEAGKRERVPLRPHLPIAVLGLMMLAAGTIGTYIRSYITTYAIATLHMRANVAFAATIVVGLCGVSFDLVTGALSDRIGRKPVMLAGGGMLLASVLPAFYVISHYRTTATLLGATAVLSISASLCLGPIMVWMTESLPAAIRSGGVAVIYAVSIATFGGSTQYMVTWLIRKTGSPMAPAWYWMAALVVGVSAMIATRESAPCKVPAAIEIVRNLEGGESALAEDVS